MYLLLVYLLLFSSIFSFLFGSFLGIIIVYLNVIFLFLSLILVNFIIYEVVLNHFTCYLKIGNWFFNLNMNFNFELIFDELSVIMLFVVLFISFFVHLFSISYMKGDPNYNKFFFYLTSFTFFMIILVLSTNFVQFFIGWEGIGLCSYLLINFWSSRLEANRSAIKALILNKIGDCAFYIFIVYFFFLFDTFDFIYSNSIALNYLNIKFIDYLDIYIFDFLSLFLILAAIAKSAQIGLHVWSPDAMEGPTPVSSLLHAATMVTAGIYLLLRVSWILDLSNFLIYIVFIGIFTNFFTSLTAIFQYDIKKIIAYSTASQSALMFIAIGLSSYNLSFFHLFNHAFFKALLFLSAGSIIHFLNNKQDLRFISFLNYFMPFTYISFLIGQLTLIGFPFLSAYYSKDMLLNLASINMFYFNYFVFWFLNISIVLTSFYSLRLLKIILWKSSKKIILLQNKNFNEFNIYVFVPLFILSLFSLFGGYLFSDIFINKILYFFKDNFMFNFFNDHNHNYVNILEYSNLFILFLTFVGVYLGFYFDFFLEKYNFFFNKHVYNYLILFNKKWLFDTIYYYVTILFFNLIYNYFYKFLDKFFFESITIVYFVKLFKKNSLNFNFFQLGQMHFYFLFFIFIFFFFFIIIFFYKFMFVILLLLLLDNILLK